METVIYSVLIALGLFSVVMLARQVTEVTDEPETLPRTPDQDTDPVELATRTKAEFIEPNRVDEIFKGKPNATIDDTLQ